jgi:phage terminase large subunit-like protein
MVPRKNGKTYKAAAVALNMFIAGGNLQPDGRFSKEAGAEVYFLATKEDQAKIGWGDCARIVKRSPGFAGLIAKRMKELRYDEEDAICKPLGSDSDSLDGLNPNCGIKDEFHAWKDRDLHDVIDDAYGARDQPLDFIITTEGALRGGIHDEIVQHAQNVLLQVYADDTFFAMIYTIDEGDDPFAEASWFKANPNLGVSKSLDYMRDQAAKARMLPSKLSTFLTKQLDVRVNAETAWLSLDQWDGCAGEILEASLAGRRCVAALDLARSIDMSAVAFLFPADRGIIEILMRYWIPEEGIDEREKRDRVPYRLWAEKGFLKLTDGNVTDFREIESDIVDMKKRFALEELGYDPMFATDLALRLRDREKDAVSVIELPQTYRTFTMPCTEMERRLQGKLFRHGGHPILRWNARNVVVRKGPSGNMMPDKAKSSARIDGMTAVLMGLNRLLLKEPETGSVYETRGIEAF